MYIHYFTDDATRALYVHLPSGTNTTIEVSPSNTVLQLKKKIEMMDKNYLVSHQRLIYVGFCDDLPDESYIISDYIDLYCGGPYLTLKGIFIIFAIPIFFLI